MAVSLSDRELRREQGLILGSLLLLAVVAWVLLLLWPESMQSTTTTMGGMGTTGGSMGSALTAGLRAPLFLLMWTVMMVAMMFPASAPMILTFARIQAAKEQREQAFVPTWVFIAGYLLVWIAAGVVAFLLATGADRLAAHSMFLMDNAGRIGGLLLVLAGAYQLTPFKTSCLTKCRTPFSFIMTSWRDGAGGALRMGLKHGAYCLGCCWFLFAILFPLGIMNLAAMALITAVIAGEKILSFGRPVVWLTAAVLIAYGLVVLVHPGALPTTM